MAGYPHLHVALMVNPVSASNKLKRVADSIEQMLKDRSISYVPLRQKWPEDLKTFTEAWIVGGDGTINYFINKFPGINIPLALFPGGTGNDLCWKLYGDIATQAQFNLVLTAKPKAIDMIQCNNRRFINSMGIGFDGEIIQSMKLIRFLGGHLGYLAAAIKNIFTFKEAAYEISVGDKKLRGKFLLIAVNNNTRTGGGFMVTPRALLDDGLLDVVLCEPLPVVKRLKYLPVIQNGKHLELKQITYIQEKEIKVICEREISAHLDGELMVSKIFTFKILPSSVYFKY